MTSGGNPIICPGHSRPVPDIEYSPVTQDGYFLISSCLDGKAMLREGKSGDWIGTFMGHKGAVWSARLNRDATKATTASADFSAKLWCAVTGKELHHFPHRHIVKTAIFSEDGSKLFTGGQEKKLRVYDINQPEAEPSVLEGHEASVSYICTTGDPNLVVTGGAEKNARIWDLRSAECVKILETQEEVTCMTRSHDNTTISTTSGQTATMWDATTFEKIKSFTLDRSLDCVAYHPEQKRFLTGSDAELWVRVYDFETGEEVDCHKGHHGPVRSLAFAPEGTCYASGSVDGTIRIWGD